MLGTRLYVGNLPYEASEMDIQAFFEQEGARKVTQVKIVTDRETGRPRGFAFVELTEPQMVRSAIDELHGADFGGRTIVVNEAREPQRRGFDREARSGAVIDRPGQGSYAAPRQAQRRSGGYGQD